MAEGGAQVTQRCNCSIADYDARLMTSIRPTQKVVSDWEIVIRERPGDAVRSMSTTD